MFTFLMMEYPYTEGSKLNVRPIITDKIGRKVYVWTYDDKFLLIS